MRWDVCYFFHGKIFSRNQKMATLRLHRPLSATHLFCFFFIVLLAQGEAGKFVKFDYAGHNNMLYVPSKASKNASLIVMLHGCVQTAVDFADGTRMVL